MPRAKKLPGQAVDRRNGQKLVSLPTGQVDRMRRPAGLSLSAQHAWTAFWSDRQAQLLTPSGKLLVTRWIRALDRYERTVAEADLSPLVSGSTHQSVANPLYRIAADALRIAQECEKQLGIGGVNAANLGLATIAEAKSLADMNSRYADGGDEDDGDAEQDPREFRVIDG